MPQAKKHTAEEIIPKLRAAELETGASADKIDQVDYTFWKTHFGQSGRLRGCGSA